MKIQLLAPGDTEYFKQGTEIIRNGQGAKSISTTLLADFSKADECCVFGAVEDRKIVGIANAGIMSENQLSFYITFVPKLKDIYKAGNIGVLLFNSVSESYQGKGVGTQLLHKRVEWLKEKGVKYIIANSWNSKKELTSPFLFRKNNFTQATHYCSYGSHEDVNCPVCNNGCHCEYFVFIKET